MFLARLPDPSRAELELELIVLASGGGPQSPTVRPSAVVRPDHRIRRYARRPVHLRTMIAAAVQAQKKIDALRGEVHAIRHELAR